MSDTSPYGYTDRASDQTVTANQLVGEKAGLTTANAMAGGPAFLSTGPYYPHDQRHRSRKGKCLGKNDSCQAPPIRGTDWCYFHTKDEE